MKLLIVEIRLFVTNLQDDKNRSEEFYFEHTCVKLAVANGFKYQICNLLHPTKQTNQTRALNIHEDVPSID